MSTKAYLYQFYKKYVNIIAANDRVFNHWYVDLYETAEDNDGDDMQEEGIGIDAVKGQCSGVYLYSSEIISIELAE